MTLLTCVSQPGPEDTQYELQSPKFCSTAGIEMLLPKSKHCQAIDKIKIDRNREEGGFLGLGKDLAELELWSFIVTDNQTPPDVSKLLLTTTELRAKKELVAKITKTVLGNRQIRKIDKIKDGAEMNFGFNLWRSPSLPDWFDQNLGYYQPHVG